MTINIEASKIKDAVKLPWQKHSTRPQIYLDKGDSQLTPECHAAQAVFPSPGWKQYRRPDQTHDLLLRCLQSLCRRTR